MDDLVARLRAAGCVFAEEEARLLADASDEQVARRVAGEPLEHVLGWAELMGVRVLVDPGVFVPRRRSELLVRTAATLGPDLAVDLCCGSGALGLVLQQLTGAEVHSADLDPVAVACARRNLTHVYEGDLFGPLPTALRGHVDVVLANVPYVPRAAVALLPAEAREHEPLLALDGGPDGLDVLRRVAADAATWLRPGGSVLSEVGETQAPAALAELEAAGLRARAVTDEDATVVVGTRP